MTDDLEFTLSDGRKVTFSNLRLESFRKQTDTDTRTDLNKGYVKAKREDGSEDWYAVLLTNDQEERLNQNVKEENR